MSGCAMECGVVGRTQPDAMLAVVATQRRILREWKHTFPHNSVILDPTMTLDDATRVPVAKCRTCGNIANLVARIAQVVPDANYVGSSLEQVSKKAKHMDLKCVCGGAFHTPVLGLQDVACAFDGTLWVAHDTDEVRNDDPTLYKIAPTGANGYKAATCGMQETAPAALTGGVEDKVVEEQQQQQQQEDMTQLTLLCSTYRYKVLPWVREHGMSSAGYTGPIFKSLHHVRNKKVETEMCVAYSTVTISNASSPPPHLDGRVALWTREAQYVGKKPWTFGERVRKPTDLEMVTRTFQAPALLLALLDKAVGFVQRFVSLPVVLRECLESETCHIPLGADERITVWRLETQGRPLLDLTCRDCVPVHSKKTTAAFHPVVVVTCELDALLSFCCFP